MGAFFGAARRHCFRDGLLCPAPRVRGETFGEILPPLGVRGDAALRAGGAEVDLSYALRSFGPILAVIFLALFVRMGGVFLCVLGSRLNGRERLFCMAAYTPKATVQAAIGAIPLSMGLACGQTVLTAAVLAILITAPLGAFLTDLLAPRLLQREEIPTLSV